MSVFTRKMIIEKCLGLQLRRVSLMYTFANIEKKKTRNIDTFDIEILFLFYLHVQVLVIVFWNL